MGIRFLGLNVLLAVPLPVWGFISALEPWQQALAIVVGTPTFVAVMGVAIGLHQALKERIYAAITGRDWPRSGMG